MAYLDTASNLVSKPKRYSTFLTLIQDKNSKRCTWKFFGVSYKKPKALFKRKKMFFSKCNFLREIQSYIYQVLQTIQIKLILLCVWAELAVLGSAKTALKFIYKI